MEDNKETHFAIATVLKGDFISTYEQASKRMEICQGCEHLKIKSVCGLCKCFLPAKTWLADESCPNGLW